MIWFMRLPARGRLLLFSLMYGHSLLNKTKYGHTNSWWGGPSIGGPQQTHLWVYAVTRLIMCSYVIVLLLIILIIVIILLIMIILMQYTIIWHIWYSWCGCPLEGVYLSSVSGVALFSSKARYELLCLVCSLSLLWLVLSLLLLLLLLVVVAAAVVVVVVAAAAALSSKAKYDSKTGWPSFSAPIKSDREQA